MPPHVAATEPTTPVNRDPLTDQFTRGRISNAQLRAGQEFRKLLAIAKEGTDDHRAADEALARSYRALGTDGSALVHDIANRRNDRKAGRGSARADGARWSKYYAKRFSECLNTLIFGFANATGTCARPRSDERGVSDQQGPWPMYMLMARAHRFAIDYIEQAPVIVLAAARGNAHVSRSESAFIQEQLL